MKNKIKKVVLTLVVCMGISLTGCGNETKSDDLASWEEGDLAEDQDLEELEMVEHQADAKKYSVQNEGVASASVYVYVCGQVNRPGVYELPGGSRIYEAIESAGGMTEDAVPEAINQALLVEDGMQITVPAEGELLQLEMEAKEKGLINLNTADVATLTTLKGIGTSRAEAIVAYREENGSFKSIEDIMNVPGIKQGAFDKIKDSITVY